MSSSFVMLTPFQAALSVNFGCNLLMWLVSASLKTDYFFDLTGATAHVLSVIAALSLGARTPHTLVGGAMVCVWATRLGVFLFTRVLDHKGDARLAAVKTKPLRFGIYWLLQTIWILCNTAPLLVACAPPPPGGASDAASAASLSIPEVAALALWLFGLCFEVVADEQKRIFRAVKDNSAFIRSGLWAYSRHPNYFGEIAVWVGFAAFHAPALLARGGVANALVLLTPLFTVYLLLRISGVPPLELAGLKKWGADEAYQRHVLTVNVLVPSAQRAVTAEVTAEAARRAAEARAAQAVQLASAAQRTQGGQ